MVVKIKRTVRYEVQQKVAIFQLHHSVVSIIDIVKRQLESVRIKASTKNDMRVCIASGKEELSDRRTIDFLFLLHNRWGTTSNGGRKGTMGFHARGGHE